MAAAVAVAIISARPYAGGWYDGSRLATVESLVDYHTLAIDRSIFVQASSGHGSAAPSPYPPDEPALRLHGTRDKLFINGRFYSDKPPVPALLMAGIYQILQWTTGLTARRDPGAFCYWMTLASSGLAYAVAVWCIFQLGLPLRLPPGLRMGLTASFGLSTAALTYVRQVNSHIVLLGVAAALYLALASMGEDARAGRMPCRRLLGLGTLAGFGYTIDLGAGPILLACTVALVAYRCRRFSAVATLALAALPWLALHHALNYAVGGTFRPANAVPEYLQWPGSPFSPSSMTGVLAHATVGHFLIYSAALLAGKRGFLGHNLPLFLAVPGLVALLRGHVRERPEVLHAASWFLGTWIAYALFSNNYSGLTASIRWFVPLLACGYFILAIFLREYPRYQGDFLLLSGWGAVVGGLMWWKGPWMKHMVPLFWPIQGAAFLSWILCRVRQGRREGGLRGAAPSREGGSGDGG